MIYNLHRGCNRVTLGSGVFALAVAKIILFCIFGRSPPGFRHPRPFFVPLEGSGN